MRSVLRDPRLAGTRCGGAASDEGHAPLFSLRRAGPSDIVTNRRPGPKGRRYSPGIGSMRSPCGGPAAPTWSGPYGRLRPGDVFQGAGSMLQNAAGGVFFWGGGPFFLGGGEIKERGGGGGGGAPPGEKTPPPRPLPRN